MIATAVPVWVLMVWHGSIFLASGEFYTPSACEEARQIMLELSYEADCAPPKEVDNVGVY